MIFLLIGRIGRIGRIFYGTGGEAGYGVGVAVCVIGYGVCCFNTLCNLIPRDILNRSDLCPLATGY